MDQGNPKNEWFLLKDKRQQYQLINLATLPVNSQDLILKVEVKSSMQCLICWRVLSTIQTRKIPDRFQTCHRKCYSRVSEYNQVRVKMLKKYEWRSWCWQFWLISSSWGRCYSQEEDEALTKITLMMEIWRKQAQLVNSDTNRHHTFTLII